MNQEQTVETPSQQGMLVGMLVTAWDAHNKRLNATLDKLTDEELAGETANGRNTGTYLLGHLTAVNDAMIPLLGLGEKLYPEMTEAYVTNPDKKDAAAHSIAELKERWHAVNAKLGDHFSNMSTDEWFEKHTAVSAEDFAKEPHRNRLAILISRTTHQGYHMGQMAYLAKK